MNFRGKLHLASSLQVIVVGIAKETVTVSMRDRAVGVLPSESKSLEFQAANSATTMVLMRMPLTNSPSPNSAKTTREDQHCWKK